MMEMIPKDTINLRACLLCHLIKSADQFDKQGCDNCEQYISLKRNRDMVAACTTSNFSGFIGLADPNDSWVARWQRIHRKARGVYAISVSGKLPTGLQNELRSMGVIESKPPKA